MYGQQQSGFNSLWFVFVFVCAYFPLLCVFIYFHLFTYQVLRPVHRSTEELDALRVPTSSVRIGLRLLELRLVLCILFYSRWINSLCDSWQLINASIIDNAFDENMKITKKFAPYFAVCKALWHRSDAMNHNDSSCQC